MENDTVSERRKADSHSFAYLSGVLQHVCESREEISTDELAEKFNESIDRADSRDMFKIE